MCVKDLHFEAGPVPLSDVSFCLVANTLVSCSACCPKCLKLVLSVFGRNRQKPLMRKDLIFMLGGKGEEEEQFIFQIGRLS